MKETLKTITIAVLVSGILSFIAGAHYEHGTMQNLVNQTQMLVKSQTQSK